MISSSLTNNLDERIDAQNPDAERKYGRTIAIHAPKRKGKTLTMVMLILHYLELLPYIEGVVSNLNLKLPSPYDKMCRPITDLKFIPEYQTHILALDELRNIIDSRMSSSFRNIFISNILKDTGKLEQIFLYTDQDSMSIDKRVRLNVDAVLRPSINFKTGLMTVKTMKNYRHYWEIEAYSAWKLHKDEFYFPFRQYYDYYDHKQKIEEYFIGFTPKEHYDLFISWFNKRGYTEEIKITMGTLKLFKTMNPELYLTNDQLSGLMEFMKRETDHNIRGGRK
jgi:hypothetical protein